MALSGDTSIIGPSFDYDMGEYSGSVFVLSDKTVEHGRRYRKAPPKMGMLVIGLELVLPYLVTLLSLGIFMTMRGGLIVDLVMCTPRLSGSGYITSIYFLRMVQLMTTMGIVLQFWGVLLSLAPLPLGQ